MYTFDEWNKGFVTLNGTYYCAKKTDDKILKANFSDFNIKDQNEIKKAQKKYFDEEVFNNLNYLIDKFIERYERSEFKIDLLNNETKQVYDILFSEVPKSELITLVHWNVSFSYEKLQNFRELFKRYKLNGYEMDYSFQNSTLSPYFCDSMSPEAEFESLYSYFKFLEKSILDALCVFNPANWNKKCYLFFKFLNENYELKNGKPKYVLFYHFLYEIAQKNSHNLIFNFKHVNYIRFVTENFYPDFNKPSSPKMNKSSYYAKNSKPLLDLFIDFNSSYSEE